MFKEILDLIVNCWERLTPLEIIHAYAGAGVLRCGHYHRTLGPGLHWKIPIFEEMIHETTCRTTMRLPTQTLTTRDDVQVEIGAVIRYEINDLREYITKVWDQKDALADETMGAIQEVVAELTYDELRAQAQAGAKRVLERVRGAVNELGFKVHRVTITDIGRTRSLRLNTRSPMKDIEN